MAKISQHPRFTSRPRCVIKIGTGAFPDTRRPGRDNPMAGKSHWDIFMGSFHRLTGDFRDFPAMFYEGRSSGSMGGSQAEREI